ncbi:hypothetical protein [Sphaerisporangium aureirubrum]|uniref:Com family DNA-binding transcriptional regulator n=1 Tax=Sphaerisporangium aureirubrum TaxID=1544736 RepID=A0ABW1NU21_9ACTN
MLDGLRCEVCRCLNMLWLDPVRGIIECHACHQTAIALPPENGGEAR